MRFLLSSEEKHTPMKASHSAYKYYLNKSHCRAQFYLQYMVLGAFMTLPWLQYGKMTGFYQRGISSIMQNNACTSGNVFPFITIQRLFCPSRDIFLIFRIKVILFRRTSYGLPKSLQIFSVKGQILNSMDCMVSVIPTQFCHCIVNAVNEWAFPFSNKTLFEK